MKKNYYVINKNIFIKMKQVLKRLVKNSNGQIRYIQKYLIIPNVNNFELYLKENKYFRSSRFDAFKRKLTYHNFKKLRFTELNNFLKYELKYELNCGMKIGGSSDDIQIFYDTDSLLDEKKINAPSASTIFPRLPLSENDLTGYEDISIMLNSQIGLSNFIECVTL